METDSTSKPTGKVPIIYSDNYNVTAFGIEKLHPFDTQKYRRVYEHLLQAGVISKENIIEPQIMASDDELKECHTEEYLKKLNYSYNIAGILEVPCAVMLPAFLIHRKVLNPMKYATKGTIMAVDLALQHGWAINLGGGFHHASSDSGGGFCVYADISIAAKIAMKKHKLSRIMIVDLDAHQGNGYGRDFRTQKNNVYIFDIYNKNIYPNDELARDGISKDLRIPSRTGDDTYLKLLGAELPNSLNDFNPELIIYNAGTDCLIGDPLGSLQLTPTGITNRDELVFKSALERNIPIVMVLSGGYQMNNAAVISDSLISLFQKLNLLAKFK